ncbi:MAG: hypothetical protein VX519_01830 [Myxococcota bacterium]|nr:hypothetical protein [Myxococcota bacterium]
MHRLFDPNIVQVSLQGDPESNAPLHWKAALSTTRKTGESIHTGCPEFGPPEMGESLSRWMLETSPAIQLEMQVSSPARQSGLASQLTVHAIGPTEDDAVSLALQAGNELASWLTLYGEHEHWSPCLPIPIQSGFVSAFGADHELPDKEDFPWGATPHHVGATARFLECISWNNMALSLKIRTAPPSEDLVEEYERTYRALKSRRDHAKSLHAHINSCKLISQLKQLMVAAPQPFKVNMDLYSPASPNAITRVLAEEAIEEWTYGTPWLEEAMEVAARETEATAQASMAMDRRSTGLLLKWMSGVLVNAEHTEKQAPQARAAAGDVIPF